MKCAGHLGQPYLSSMVPALILEACIKHRALLILQVWSEPSMVDAGAYEFAHTDRFLQVGACPGSSALVQKPLRHAKMPYLPVSEFEGIEPILFAAASMPSLKLRPLAICI